MGKITVVMAALNENASDPIVVAKVIYEAATDGTKHLRCTAGDDAAQFMAQRKSATDAEFMAGLKKQFGI